MIELDRRHFVGLAASLAAVALLTAAPSGSLAAGPSDTLRVAEMWEIDNLDPARSGTFIKEKAMVVETLVEANPDFSLKPGLAVEWTWGGDREWTFRLREGVKFHDGSPLTAEAVVASMERAFKVTPSLKTMPQIDKVEVTGPLAIRVTTTAPTAILPATMVSANLSIVALSSETTADGTIVKPVGTGAFMVDEWKRSESSLFLKRNPAYWGGKAAIEKIVFRGVPDPSTRSLEIQKGDVDFVPDAPYGDLEMLARKGFQTSRHITSRVYELDFGSLNGTPYEDPRVRHAISHAIDRKAIVDKVLFGMGAPAAGPFRDGVSFAAPGLAVSAYDVAKAKALLDEAGWVEKNGVRVKDGKPFEVVLYTYPQRPGLPPVATALQAMLGKVGIKAAVKLLDQYAIIRTRKPEDMRLIAYTTAMYPDPDYFLRRTYHSTGADNAWKYANPEVDRLLDLGAATKDAAARKAAYDQVQRIIARDEPTVLVSYYGVNIVMKPEVKGFVFNPVAHDFMLGTDLKLER
jgi:peptide/nickel transport system substrate-binding protein